jgi:hypothetical protein
MRVGIVGIGQISGQYLKTLPRLTNLELTAVADLDPSRSVPGIRTLTPAGLYAADDVDIVLNLTIPAAHQEVALAAIARQVGLRGETTGPEHRTGPRDPRRGGGRGCSGGLRPGHRAGHRRPDRPGRARCR